MGDTVFVFVLATTASLLCGTLGQVSRLEGEDAKVDGVMFAATDFGDCFVFDVSAENKDYPVYWYQHEENAMELYARNFAECIKRFVSSG